MFQSIDKNGWIGSLKKSIICGWYYCDETEIQRDRLICPNSPNH